uniref:Uncharacterized protein n=1 Tax=Cucumis melo TaxID=3656 RepID=A0A9I9EFE0_CUCME
MVGKGKAFNNTRVKRSIKVPTISNKLVDMMIIHGGNMAKSQSRLLHTQGKPDGWGRLKRVMWIGIIEVISG